MITNEKMDAFTALHLYRMKDVVEKAFGNLKERLNMRRLLVSSEKGLDGKIFTEFVALILISHLDHKMKKSDLYKNYTLHQLLDELDVIECFEDANHSLMLMYGKEASNRKQEIDRQHHTIPNQRNQRPKDKHCGNVHNRLWNHG